MGSVCCTRKSKEDPPLKDRSKYEGLDPEQQVHAACCEDDVEYLERLATAGVNLDALRKPDNLHALDACAWAGNTDCGQALLRHGASPAKTVQAIVGATAWGSCKFLEAMLKLDGPVDQEMSDSTAAHWAVQMNQEEALEVLLRYGAWEKEPEQDLLLERIKRKRWQKQLNIIAEHDPDVAEDCVLPPYRTHLWVGGVCALAVAGSAALW